MHNSYAPLFQHIPGIVLAAWATKEKGAPLLEAGQAYCSFSNETWTISAMFSSCLDGKQKNCCILCQADSEGVNSWKNFSQTAPWVSTSWNTENWRLYPDRSKCKLFEDIPGSTALLCSLDFMHNKFLGCDQYGYGSVMLLLSI